MNKIDEENPPMRSALDLLLDMGHERGLKEGVQIGVELMRSLVLLQLRARFGEPEPEHHRQLQGADAEELKVLGTRLATAATLGDVSPD